MSPRPIKTKVFNSIQKLQKKISELKKKHPETKVVFTNGCFDLLHLGHITYLNQARNLGQILIVGINQDRSVKKLKGPNRPIQPFKDRATILAALESVDYVISFSSETPAALIKALSPDILVKGGDYKISQIVGAETVLKKGGKVKILPYIKGRSSSELIKKLYSLG